MATGGGPRFSVKRFAYDMLIEALSTCDFPVESLEVTIEDKNNYPHNNNDVLTVLAGTLAIAFRSREDWKILFRREQSRSGLNNMRKIEQFLSVLEESPEFRLEGDADKVMAGEKDPMPEESAEFQPAGDSDKTMVEENVSVPEDSSKFQMVDDSDQIEGTQHEFIEPPEYLMIPYLEKIRKSLALYSELILFLNHQKIKVNFERLLDLWSRYFNEKIAVKHDPDQLLMAMFIEDTEIEGYLDGLGYFIREVATPYGDLYDVSKSFKDFNTKLDDFKKVPKPWLATIPEELEEAVQHFDDLLQKREDDREPREKQENPNGVPLPAPDIRDEERRLEKVDLEGNEETTPESDKTN